MLTLHTFFEPVEHSTLVSLCLFMSVPSRGLLDNVTGPQDRIRRFTPVQEQICPFHLCFLLEPMGEVYMRLKLNTLHQKMESFSLPLSPHLNFVIISDLKTPMNQDTTGLIVCILLRLIDLDPAQSRSVSARIASHGQTLINVPVRRDTGVKANIMW